MVIQEVMKVEGIFPLPKLGTISCRASKIKKSLGIFPQVKKSLEKPEDEARLNDVVDDTELIYFKQNKAQLAKLNLYLAWCLALMLIFD